MLVVQPLDHSMLVRKESSRLPTIQFSGCVESQLGWLCKSVQNQLKSCFRVIRLRKECNEYMKRPPKNRDYLLIFEIPTGEPLSAPESTMWMLQSEAHEIQVVPAAKNVEQYLLDYKLHGLEVNSALLYPYSREGWFDLASVWISQGLPEDIGTVDMITQLQSGADGCLLRARLKSGQFLYFKASNQKMWNREANAIHALSEVMPELFEKPVLLNLEKQWILMRDFGDTFDYGACNVYTNPKLMKKILSDWARVQVKSVSMIDRLARMGVPVMDGEELLRKSREMAYNSEWFEEQRKGMTEKQREKYSDQNEYAGLYLDYVNRLLRRVAMYNVPLAITHGDLEPVNVVLNGTGDCVFIHFFYTQVSFPFLDAVQVALACGGDLEAVDFYLDFWTDYETKDRLRELLSIVDDIHDADRKIDKFKKFQRSEESERAFHRKEMRFTVIHTFGKYHEVESELSERRHTAFCVFTFSTALVSQLSVENVFSCSRL